MAGELGISDDKTFARRRAGFRVWGLGSYRIWEELSRRVIP